MLALAGIRRLVASIKAIEKDDLVVDGPVIHERHMLTRFVFSVHTALYKEIFLITQK